MCRQSLLGPLCARLLAFAPCATLKRMRKKDGRWSGAVSLAVACPVANHQPRQAVPMDLRGRCFNCFSTLHRAAASHAVSAALSPGTMLLVARVGSLRQNR
jgi:hypothetical protein